MKALNTYVVSVAALLVAAAVPAYAQQASTRSCSGKDPIGYIGISGIACDCTIAPPGTDTEWRFRTEPKITSLEMDARAAGVLKTGDVIIAVNEKLITTREGAQEFANIRPGVPVVLTLRRNGQALKVALTPESICPSDTRALGIYAPTTVPAMAPSVYVGSAPTMVTPRAEAAAGTPPPQSYYVPSVAPVAYSSLPRASFGMGLSCSNCAMSFSEKEHTALMLFSRPPEVYPIERGGPADRAGIRRGDVITHVNGKRLDSEEGGKLFATARPGQTVNFTVVRNAQRKVYPVKAVARATPAPDMMPPPELAQSSRYLQRARESLTQLQRSQEEQLRRLQDEVRRTQQMQEEQLREAQRQMLREEQQHRERLAQLSTEMYRAERQMRAAIADSARSACVVAPTTLKPSTARSARTLRYTGTLGDAEIEVRGANPVSVTEDGDEIVITTGATVVRVQKKK